MLRNIIKVAIRNIVKDKFYSFLNIIGLSIGIAASLLIVLFVVDELSYDKFFKGNDRIYRVITIGNLGDNQVMHIATTGAPFANAMKSEMAEVESVTRMQPTILNITHEGQVFKETKVTFADSTFFDVFSFAMIAGDPEKSLVEPNSIVLTKSKAIKYFGETQVNSGNVIGELLRNGDDVMKITGILEDIPHNTHMDFEIFVSMSTNQDALNPVWINMNYYAYAKLLPGTDPVSLEPKLRSMVMSHVVPQVVAYLNFPEAQFTDETIDQAFKFVLQPITDIHLKSELMAEFSTNGNILYVYMFSTIAIFIILIACINFMNLATARSVKRAKEVGIRKTLGSDTNSLSIQFLFESLLYIIISVMIALGLTEAFRVPFNTIADKELSFNIFQNPWILLIILGITFLIAIIAGSYPAFYLARFKPVDVLKGSKTSGSKKSVLRSILVVIQFMISIGLTVSTLLVFKQMDYIQTKNLGFEKENVIIIKNINQLGDQAESFRQELYTRNEIIAASRATHVPSDSYWSSAYKAEGENESDHVTFMSFCGFDYDKALGFDIKHGRYFSEDFPSDSSAIVINEAAAFTFGWTENMGADAIGKKLETINQFGQRDKLTVIGVMTDINFQSLRSEVRGMVIRPGTFGDKMVIRVNPGNHRNTVEMLETMWKKYLPMVTFEYSFLDEDYGKMFSKETRMSTVFSIFAVLAILIACMGLLGLAAFTAEQRTKEIGIRKVMGASSKNVVSMLTMEFTKLIMIAFVIAIPISWYLMKQWFNGFAYKTDMGIWPFILSGLIALLISWITVSYQSIKAALANPVNSLRNE